MNLLVAIVGPGADALITRAQAAVERAASAFPALAERRARTIRSEESRAILVSVTPPDPIVDSRAYTHEDAATVVVFDGLPLSPSGERMDRSDVLASRFETLSAELEGAFTVMRLHVAEERLEVLTDPLGNLPVYSTRLADGTRVLGTSLAAVADTAGAGDLDPVGVSTFMTLGWYGERRTPLAGVSVLPGGALVTLHGEGTMRIDRHFGIEHLLRREPRELPELTSALVGLIRSAAAPSGSLDLGLTAGRDSRVCLGVALAAGVQVNAYTEGHEGMADVEAAGDLSRALGIRHSVLEPPAVEDCDVEKLIRSFVAQGDCASSFSQLADQFPQLAPPQRLARKLVGLGGEAVRANTHPVRAFLLAGRPASDSAGTQRFLTLRKATTFGGLAEADCLEMTAGYVDRWFAARRGEGYPNRLLAESLYVFDAMVRVHNGSVRRTAGTAHLAAPLSSRPVLRFGWSRPLSERYVDGVHRSILEATRPELLETEFDRWPAAQERYLLARSGYELVRLARRRRGPSGNALALEDRFWAAQLGLHRELIDSTPDSPLWELVDRTRLRDELESGNGPSAGVMRALSVLWWLHAR